MPWNREPLPVFRGECPPSSPHTLCSPSRLAHPEGTTLAPRPRPCGIQQLHVHLASVEKARLHHGQDCQLHCALQPLGAQERLPGHLLHQVGSQPMLPRGGGRVADGDDGRDPGDSGTFPGSRVAWGHSEGLRSCWCQLEKGVHPIPSPPNRASHSTIGNVSRTDPFLHLRGLPT